MDIQDIMVYRDTRSRTIDKYLMSREGRVVAVRRHPAVLLPAFGLALGSMIACGAAATVTGLMWLWWPWLLTLTYVGWKLTAWSIEFFLVSEHRAMLITGVLTRTVLMMPLTKVTDMELQRSVPGRLLGYGEFIIESAGEPQSLRKIRFMPYPEQLYLECCGVIFSAEDKAPD